MSTKTKKRAEALAKPQDPDNSLNYRAVAMMKPGAGMQPMTVDKEKRCVDVTAATENPVMVYDWDYGRVGEVLLMSGCQLPESRQIPLLDSHQRWNTSSVIGSCRDLAIEGDQLAGCACYSTAPEAEGPFLKMCEGHLTDYSIGYNVNEATYIPEGQTGIVGGRTFQGPIKVVTDWTPRELSTCPIGADQMAKARAATAPAIQKRGEKDMDEKIRKYLESRGLSADATEEEALAFLQTLDVRSEVPSAPAAPAVTEDMIRATVRSEQDRCFEIRGLCLKAGIEEKADEYIRNNTSVNVVRKEAFEYLTSAAPKTAGFSPSVEMGADSRDKFRAAAEDALMLRSGILDIRGKTIESPAPGARDLMGFGLRELARECLRQQGLSVGGSLLEVVGRALTTSDFPNILANVANKSLFEGYTTNEETWQIWCATGSVNDFKTNTLVRASETEDLDQIPEEGEYKYGKRSDAKETYAIATYGKLAAISRQTIINDDLGALTDTFAAHGEAWSRKVGDIAYAVLTANAAMGDGTALFHANHGNLGTTGLIGTTTLAEGIKLMKLQKDIGGKRRLNIRPQFVIAPVSVEGAAEIFFTSGVFADGTGSNSTGALAATRTNPYAGARFTRVYEPRLDDSSATAWYLAGAKGKTVKVFFLGGNQGPYMETKQGWSVDGVEFKVRGDAGAKAVDWKAMVKNAGS